MEVTPIYLTNIDLAIEMKKAGFDKECVHHMTVHIDAIIYAYDKIIEILPNKYKSGIYQLPTLGEIELPEGIAIYKEKDLWHIAIFKRDEAVHAKGQFKPISTCYKTELQARCYAWLLVKRKEV